MAELITKNRKSNVLTPSQLLCLSKIPTVNITSGCIHGCIYCYATGYSQYPGDGEVILFANTVQKLSEELARKRKKPQAVYFCPSCDPFQPVPEILDQTYRVMKVLLLQNIGVQLVTKADIPANFIDLFAQSSSLVCAQVGITTVDDNIRRIFEPNAASISDRLSTMRKLVSIGVKTSARADPLIHSVTDSDESLSSLFSAVAEAGVKEVAAGYLFLRPAIRKNLEKNIKSKALLQRILLPYFHFQAKLLPVGMNSQGLMLPREIREKAFKRIRNIASDFGLSIHICGCKNSDITAESCNITRLLPSAQLHFFS
jgi:DNA repair photolyase